MSAIIYFDEDSQKKELVRLTRAVGIISTFPNEQNTCGWSDEEQLILAATRGWVLFSFNEADFRRIHENWQLDGRIHSGIIVAEQSGETFRNKAIKLAKLLREHTTDQIRNRIWELDY